MVNARRRPNEHANLAKAGRVRNSSSFRVVAHPLRWLPGLVDARVPRHQQEEREVNETEHLCRLRVTRCRGLQPEPAERDEADRKGDQEAPEDRPAVANRSDLAAIEP